MNNKPSIEQREDGLYELSTGRKIESPLDFDEKLQAIIDGQIGRDTAIIVLKNAHLKRKELLNDMSAIALSISKAEDFLIYGESGRITAQTYR